MPVSGRIFYIAGAGVSGLTLALTLAKFGASVIVLERGAALSEFGAGLQISPNARRILDRLGLGKALTKASLEPAGIDIYPYRRARPLVTLELGDAIRQRFGAPYAVMHRADLAEALYKACRRFANIDIVFGVREWDAVSGADGVSVNVDEAAGHTRNGRAFGLIGADGVHSKTRTGLVGGPPAIGYSHAAWRTLLPFEALQGQIAFDRVSVFFAPFYHLVCYPLPHRYQVNIALFAKARPGATAPALPPTNSPRIDAILAAAGDNWTMWPLHTVETKAWHKGNIGLVGDAAHAMMPFQAQGAAMGIEDAAVLAPLLMTEATAEAAFARYESLRQDRVARVARISQANGRVFHMRWPLSVARNLVIAAQGSTAHMRRLSWLYGYDPG
jgi:salicylate hydroxylase